MPEPAPPDSSGNSARSSAPSIGSPWSTSGRAVGASSASVMTDLLGDSPALVALALELLRQLGTAGGHDPSVDEHVHPVGSQVLQQALVVGDGQHAESGLVSADLL